MVGMHMAGCRHEEEAPTRQLLECCKPRAARPGEQSQRAWMKRDLVGLHSRAGGRELSQPSLELQGNRLVGDDDAVTRTDRALPRQDLAWPFGHVLARHLDQPERDLDDVGLRAVALELLAERLLDEGAVLRVRHVDEVDDDDAADVAQAKLPHDLLDGLEVVLRSRVLEALGRGLRARADEPARVHVDDGEGLGVVEAR